MRSLPKPELSTACYLDRSKSKSGFKDVASCNEFIQLEKEYEQMATQQNMTEAKCRELHDKLRRVACSNDTNEKFDAGSMTRLFEETKAIGQQYWQGSTDPRRNLGRLCPICGLNFATTLDHYLPKSTYYCLAVTPINLVPSCSDCNSRKSNNIAANPEETAIHPFFDTGIDDETWLTVELSNVDGVMIAMYKVRCGDKDASGGGDKSGMSPHDDMLLQRVGRQLKRKSTRGAKQSILDRYNDEANAHLAALQSALLREDVSGSLRADTVDCYFEALRIEHRLQVDRVGRNHWLPVLLLELISWFDYRRNELYRWLGVAGGRSSRPSPRELSPREYYAVMSHRCRRLVFIARRRHFAGLRRWSLRH